MCVANMYVRVCVRRRACVREFVSVFDCMCASYVRANESKCIYIYIGECVCVCVHVCVCVSFRRYTRRRLWSNRDQIWHTHADSSPNGSELNKKSAPCYPRGVGAVLGGQKFKNLE